MGFTLAGIQNEFRREMIRDHRCRLFHHPLEKARSEKTNRSMLCRDDDGGGGVEKLFVNDG